MNAALQDYIEKARAKGHDDDRIRTDLISGGWDASAVMSALSGDDGLLVPPPPPSSMSHAPSGQVAPIAVVSQMTTRGFEYIIMFLALGFTAVSLGAILHSVVDTSFGNPSIFDGVISYASSGLIVSLPIFAFLFLRTKKAELADPSIRHDASRRKAIQLTLVVSFLWGVIRLISYVYSLLNGGGASAAFSDGHVSLLGNFLNTLITLGIAGGIFVYYWIDEHRTA